MTFPLIRSSLRAGAHPSRSTIDFEILAVGSLLAIAALVALWTVGDYAITVD